MSGSRRTLRIATFNVNSIRARLPILLEWLERERPSVVCLQETKAQDVDFPQEAVRAAGYEALFRGEKSYNGVAILARAPIEPVQIGFHDGGPADESRLLIARTDGVVVCNTYVPQGRAPDHPMFAYKLEWFARLRRTFETLFSPTDPMIWCGDFNVAPEPIDVHDPKRLLGHVCFHPEAQRALAAVKVWGFTDVFRKHRPDPGEYSFFDYRVKDAVTRKVGWRVDHVWATEPLAERSVDAWIDLDPRRAERPSDHTPTVAAFDWPVKRDSSASSA
jgi:exodeoxyribonuclease-3